MLERPFEVSASRCADAWSAAEDEGYDEARAVHNGMFDRRPLAVLRAEQVGDVMAAVKFAREHGLDLSVRGGGHSGPGFGTNDGGLVIDMWRDADRAC